MRAEKLEFFDLYNVQGNKIFWGLTYFLLFDWVWWSDTDPEIKKVIGIIKMEVEILFLW